MNFAATSRRRRKPLGRDGWLFVLGGLLMALAMATQANAFWGGIGTGSGGGSVGTLAAPTLSATSGAGTATITWTAVSPPGLGSVYYYVQRDGGDAAGNCPTPGSPTTLLTCTDTGLTKGPPYTYTVTAIWQTWTAISSPLVVSVPYGAMSKLVLAAASPVNAGTADNLTITAQDAAGNTVTSYTGSHDLTFTGPGAVGGNNPTVTNSSGTATNFGTATAITFTNGVATVSGSDNGVMKLYKAETAHVVVSDGTYNNGAGLSVTVSPIAVSKLLLAAATTTPAAGAADNLTITAQDTYGNTVTSYTGSKSLTFTGPGAVGGNNPTVVDGAGVTRQFGVATPITFTNGVATVSGSNNGVMKLYKAETVSIVVSDGAANNGTGLSVTVSPIAVSKLLLAAATTTPAAGAADNLTITAQDTYGNTVTSYTGTKSLTFSGPGSVGGNNPTVTDSSGAAVNFGTATAITFTNGVATVSGSDNGVMKLYKAETAHVVVSDGTYNNGAGLSVTVSPIAVSKLSLAAATTTPAAGVADNLTITAQDTYGNTVTSYNGSHNLTFTGPGAVGSNNPTVVDGAGVTRQFGVATPITFTNGVATVSGSNNGVMKLYKAETVSIVVSDGAANNGTGLSVTVSPIAVSKLLLAAATTTPAAGAADNLTITAQDTYGNTVTSYTATLGLTFTGANTIGVFHPTVSNSTGTAVNFGTSTLISFTNGVATVTGSNNGVMRLYRAEPASISATGGGFTTNAISVTVSSGTPSSFTIPTPTRRTAGTPFNLTLTATADAYGNASTSYTGTQCIVFSGPTASPNGTNPLYPLPGSCGTGQSAVSFNAGVGTASITLFDATPSTAITATDAPSGFHGSTGNFRVNGLTTMSTFLLTADDTTPTAGQAVNVTVTAGDAYGNALPNRTYRNAHTLIFSGASVIGTVQPTVNGVNFGTGTSLNFSDAGVATAVMYLYKAETANIVVSDGTHSNGSGLEVTVRPAALSVLALAAEKVVVRPGATDQLTIRAIDQYGNTAAGYADGTHNLTFAGGTGTRTVTNATGAQVNFGTATALTFTNGISTAGGVMRITTAQTANVTVTDGTRTSPALRIVVSNVTALAVSAGAFHTCALRSDGAVECWGEGDSGQLGNGAMGNSSNPVMVSGLTNAIQISAAKYHTCAVRNDGTVWCWGLNDFGELGNNSTTTSSVPVQVRGVGGTGFLTGVSSVSANGKFTCALISASQSVVCWGHNQAGQLGIGATDNNVHSTPAYVVGVGGGGTLGNVSAITTGANHACALLSGGGVDCWGLNDHGQLGNNSTADTNRPVQVVGAGGGGTLSGVTQISGGRMHVCARIGGTIYCWGRNDNGELGNGTTTTSSFPVQTLNIATATQINAGEYHSCVRLQDGTAQCWGAAAFGQIGDGTTSDTSTPVSVIGPGGFGILSGIGSVSAGGGDINETNDFEHTVALMDDGTVVSWGQNNYGQLGDGTTTMSIFPVGVALQ